MEEFLSLMRVSKGIKEWIVNHCFLLSSLTRTCPAKHCSAKVVYTIHTFSHFHSIYQRNLLVRPLPPNSMLFVVMKSLLLLYNIVVGKAVPYFNDVVSHCPQNTLSTHFRAI